MKSLNKILFTLLILLLTSSPAVFAGEIYRVCNDSTFEHLYTPSSEERDVLVAGGWANEGTSFVSPDSGDAIYRVCSPVGTHLYTSSLDEVNGLTAIGWSADFNGAPIFFSGGDVPVTRMYNPQDGNHHWTTSQHEVDVLAARGWTNEGIAFNAVQPGNIIERGIFSPEGEKRAQLAEQAAKYIGQNGTQFQNRMGIPGLAWCGAFVACVFQDCGLDYAIPMTCLASNYQNWGIANGHWHDVNSGYNPQPGDVIVYDYNRNGSGDHVGIVHDGSGPRNVNCVEGNVGSPRLVRMMNYPPFISGFVSPAL